MIRHYYLNTLLLGLLVLCFNRCAQVAPLTGGARDITPPKLTEAIPALYSINFNSDQVLLRFNEYVQLKDLRNQLLVSPRLKTEPEITSDGKKIRILLKKEELLPNTTYRIYFGKSVADMTEANTIPNFEYVFSTGNYIDSLKVGGSVTDAFNEQTVSDVLVGLYTFDKDAHDSLIYKQSPDYITRTTPDGRFAFGNLPPRTFNMVAFTDKNKNYLYDGDAEKIGFKDSSLVLKSDTTVDLKIFQENPSRIFIKKTVSPYYGVLNVIYNKKSVFKSLSLNETPGGFVSETEHGKEKDTVTFVYNGLKDTHGLIIKDLISKKTDTVKVNLPKLNLQRKKSLLIRSNVAAGVLPLHVTPELTFLNILDTLNSYSDKVHLVYKKDSTWRNEPARLLYTWPFSVKVTNTLTEGTTYKLKIDSAAFFDLNGRYNDSLLLDFKTESKTDLGKVTLKVLLNKKQAYIIQLMNDKSQKVKEEYLSLSLSSSNAVSIDFTGITPGTYSVKVVFDTNENKKWDTGDYLLNKQPEKVFTSSKQIKVLPDWDVEEEILIK